MIYIEKQFLQLLESVDSYFSRDKTENLARRDFLKFRDEVLRSVVAMDQVILEENPYYAAIGFLGHVQFETGKELAAFDKNPTHTSLTQLREAGGVQMTAEARPIWKELEEKFPEAALTVILLCSMGAKHATIKRAIKS